MISDFFTTTKKRVLKAFPERQLYLRSQGEVSYFHLSTRFQMMATSAIAGLALWSLFTIGNVITGYNPFSSSAQKLRNQEVNFERALAEERAKLENTQMMLAQQRESFHKIATNFEQKHTALTEILGSPELNAPSTELADKDNTPSYAGSRILMSPTLRDPAPRSARKKYIDEASLTTTDIDRFLVDLSENQNEALELAELDMLDDIERKRAIIRSTKIKVEDIIEASPGGRGGIAQPARFTASLTSGNFLPRMNTVQARVTEAEALDKALVSMPFGHPINDENYQTSNYGMRKDPFTKRPTFHGGHDYGGRKNAKIVATAPGVIKIAWRNGGFGKMVEIDHGHGFKTRYGHLNKINVKRGQTVTKGQVIGGMGSTGRSTSTHLHYEIHFQGRTVDPSPFLKAGKYVQ